MTTDEILEHVRKSLAPELAQIQDETLREKVVQVWARSMLLGGSSDLEKDVKLNKDLPGVGFEHVRGVVWLSIALAESLVAVHRAKLDRDVLVAGAVVHDAGKLTEGSTAEGNLLGMVGHGHSGVVLAAEQGLPPGVLHIIAYHAADGDRVRRTWECEIVHAADVLSTDALYRRNLGISRSDRYPSLSIPPTGR